MPKKTSLPKPPALRKARPPIELAATYWADAWAHGTRSLGRLAVGAYCAKKMKSTVTYLIEQAKLRQRLGASKPFSCLSDEEAAICLQTLPFRGTAQIAFLNLDLRREADAAMIPYFVLKEKTSNGRSTAGRSELWASIIFGFELFSGDAPGSDGFILFADTMELVSVKGLGKTGFSPQISSLTAHGTRDAFDLLAMLESIGLAAWIVVVDTTKLPQVQLTMIPSAAVADWARDGLIPGSGLKSEQFLNLVAASCHIEIIEPAVVDRAALARQNRIDARADALAMAPILAAQRQAAAAAAARSPSGPSSAPLSPRALPTSEAC